jgi:uncharacterized RDD family membrane protein YckC
MTASDQPGGTPPRHFWRRAFAFLLDVVLATLVVALIFGAIRAATGVDLGTPSLANFTQSKCDVAPAGHPQAVRIERMWSLVAGETRQNILCRITVNGREQPLLFVSRVIRRDGAQSFTREVRYPVDEQGQPIAIAYSMDWSAIAYLLIFGAMTAQGRRTPGKTLMGLRVRNEAGDELDWPTAFKRETPKFLPLLAYFAIGVWLAFSPPALLSDSEASIIAIRDGSAFTSPYMVFFILLGIATLVWWVGPFLIWRGRTWYDALAGTKVVRSDRAPPNGPRQR